MMTDIQANKSWMIKELRGERLSDNADTALFFICVTFCSFSAWGRNPQKAGKKMGEGDVVLLGELKGHHTIWPEKNR